MGNCLNRMSSDASLPSSSSSAPTINMNAAIHVSVLASHRKGLPFTPILPFATQSNLGAVYLLGSELGRGQSGIIHQCTSHSAGAIFACKSISKLRLCTARDVEDVVREVRIMKHLSNPIPSHAGPDACTSLNSCLHGSIVCLQDIIEDKAFVHLIMELCHGGELFNRIMKKKCYPEAQAAFIIKSLLETVQFCHSMGIMHRDIKPENILLVEDSDTSAIRLADFGLALEFSPGQKFSGMAGSTYYIAPEVLQGEYSEEVDIWSVGIIMYMLLSGVPPFWGATEQRIFKAIRKGDLSFPPNPWDKISSSTKDLITQMLHPNVKLRLSPAQALKHPWILLHTKVFEHPQQSNLTANMSLIPKNAGNLGSCTSTFAPTYSETLLWTGMGNAAKPELSKFLVDIVSSMSRSTHFVSDSLPVKKLQNGWTYTVLSLNGNEETLLVEMDQEKYLVLHDRTKKKIGWKLLKEKHTLVSTSVRTEINHIATGCENVYLSHFP